MGFRLNSSVWSAQSDSDNDLEDVDDYPALSTGDLPETLRRPHLPPTGTSRWVPSGTVSQRQLNSSMCAHRLNQGLLLIRCWQMKAVF